MTKAPDLRPRAAVTLALLFGMNLLDYIDRNILAAVVDPPAPGLHAPLGNGPRRGNDALRRQPGEARPHRPDLTSSGPQDPPKGRANRPGPSCEIRHRERRLAWHSGHP